MIIIMDLNASPAQVREVEDEIERVGLRPFINPGVERKVIAVLGEVDMHKADLVELFSTMDGVARVDVISDLWKLASKSYRPEGSTVRVRDVVFGGSRIAVAAGPCSVEDEALLIDIAFAVRDAGASMLRGGAFKPRTSPYSFQGMGEVGLKLLAKARDKVGLPIVTEVMDTHDVDMVADYADMLQIGARNMQNFSLLKKAGNVNRPILLKRGPAARVRDLLMSAEYIMAEGNQNVVLCERGITTFEDSTRNTTDINALPVLKKLTHLPVILDPSHATGDWRYVAPISLAAVAAGADGLMVEVHPDPGHAKSDGSQSLKFDKFAEMMGQLKRVAEAVDRTV